MRLRPLHLAAVVAILLSTLMLSGCGGSGHKVTIGVKFDQPGLSLRKPDGSLSGFDVDVARYVAEQLGYKPDEIEWKEAPSGQRETLIQNGQVDYIVGTYSITDARKKKVAFAGPYFQTGQSLLVRADNTDIVGSAVAGEQQEAVFGGRFDTGAEHQEEISEGAAAAVRHLLAVRRGA